MELINISENAYTNEDLKVMQNWDLNRKIQVAQTRIMEWKKNHDNDYYVKCFNEQVLDKLDWFQIYEELQNLAATCGKQHYEIALICYEKPSDFCHRHLVSDWFNKNLVACEEWSVHNETNL